MNLDLAVPGLSLFCTDFATGHRGEYMVLIVNVDFRSSHDSRLSQLSHKIPQFSIIQLNHIARQTPTCGFVPPINAEKYENYRGTY